MGEERTAESVRLRAVEKSTGDALALGISLSRLLARLRCRYITLCERLAARRELWRSMAAETSLKRRVASMSAVGGASRPVEPPLMAAAADRRLLPLDPGMLRLT